MSITELPSDLVPVPAALVAVVAELVAGPWPVGEDERESLFKRLGFKSGARVELGRDASTSEMFKLSTELPGQLSANWHAYHGKFMGVFFNPYSFIEPDVPAARRGHDEIWHKLKGLHGQPTRPWDNEEVPPIIWKVNGRDIVMHYFPRSTVTCCSVSRTRHYRRLRKPRLTMTGRSVQQKRMNLRNRQE